MSNTVTDEMVAKIVEKHLEHFPWGEVLEVHTFGDIIVFEYLGDNRRGRLFHPFVGERDTCISTHDLDMAMLEGLGHKYLDCNNRFASYASRILQMKGAF